MSQIPESGKGNKDDLGDHRTSRIDFRGSITICASIEHLLTLTTSRACTYLESRIFLREASIIRIHSIATYMYRICIHLRSAWEGIC